MYKVLDGITLPNNEDTLWRYMSFEKFVSILKTKSLFYTKAYKFEDTLEGIRPQLIMGAYKKALTCHAPEEHILGVIKILEIMRRHVMCNCWHQNEEESSAMWDNYSNHNSGIAIKTTVQKLKNSLSDTMFDVFIGKIKYLSPSAYDENYTQIYLQSIINGLDLYKKWTYFPYFYKRKNFEYEREVRIIIDIDRYIEDVLRRFPGETISDPGFIESAFPDSGENGKLYRVNVNMLIDKISTSPYADERITQEVKSAIQKYGYNFKVNPSTLKNLSR